MAPNGDGVGPTCAERPASASARGAKASKVEALEVRTRGSRVRGERRGDGPRRKQRGGRVVYWGEPFGGKAWLEGELMQGPGTWKAEGSEAGTGGSWW